MAPRISFSPSSATTLKRRSHELSISLLSATLATSACSRRIPVTALEPIKVAAAADLAFAFDEIGKGYEKTFGQKVVFSFGSSGLLEKQIADGAPYDVFAAADMAFVDDAVRQGACLGATKALYATGRLALVTASGISFAPKGIGDLTDRRVVRIAIANPKHAPYGRAAEQALRRSNVWDAVESKLVYGENVQQALQFVQSGNAEASLVALSLAMTSGRPWTLIAAELHDPLNQGLVVCTGGKAGPEAGRRFESYVRSPDGRDVMRKYGFVLPGESRVDPSPLDAGP
ncbi:MAG: molybdate ABC transporter substrate-binding protein [Polyangiaceae bacterium]|jgi:molybdate transport system substrate-binding protein